MSSKDTSKSQTPPTCSAAALRVLHRTRIFSRPPQISPNAEPTFTGHRIPRLEGCCRLIRTAGLRARTRLFAVLRIGPLRTLSDKTHLKSKILVAFVAQSLERSNTVAWADWNDRETLAWASLCSDWQDCPGPQSASGDRRPSHLMFFLGPETPSAFSGRRTFEQAGHWNSVCGSPVYTWHGQTELHSFKTLLVYRLFCAKPQSTLSDRSSRTGTALKLGGRLANTIAARSGLSQISQEISRYSFSLGSSLMIP